jgi:hypothetical protein
VWWRIQTSRCFSSPDDRWRWRPDVDIPVGGQQALGLGLGFFYSPPERPGPAQAFLSVDVRREAIVLRADPMNPVRLWWLLLADAGLMGEPDQSFFERRHEWTIGFGGRAQFARRTLVGLDVGWTDAGAGMSVVTYFAY